MTTMAPEAPTAPGRRTARPSQGRGWVYAGIGAGLAGIVCIVGSMATDAAYDPDLAGDAKGITEKLADQTATILVMHVGAMASALLLVVFAAGLRRRL